MVAAMSFRTKVFLSIAATAILSVWIVAAVVSALVNDSFERRDQQRTAALVNQFQREFDRRGTEVARRIEAVANSDAVQRGFVAARGRLFFSRARGRDAGRIWRTGQRGECTC